MKICILSIPSPLFYHFMSPPSFYTPHTSSLISYPSSPPPSPPLPPPPLPHFSSLLHIPWSFIPFPRSFSLPTRSCLSSHPPPLILLPPPSPLLSHPHLFFQTPHEEWGMRGELGGAREGEEDEGRGWRIEGEMRYEEWEERRGVGWEW